MIVGQALLNRRHLLVGGRAHHHIIDEAIIAGPSAGKSCHDGGGPREIA